MAEKIFTISTDRVEWFFYQRLFKYFSLKKRISAMKGIKSTKSFQYQKVFFLIFSTIIAFGRQNFKALIIFILIQKNCLSHDKIFR